MGSVARLLVSDLGHLRYTVRNDLGLVGVFYNDPLLSVRGRKV